jgi:hypothetical protein
VAILLATGRKVRGSNPVQDSGFLWAITFRSTSSFGGELKTSAPCRMILRMIKNLAEYGKDTSSAKSTVIS